MTVSIRASLMLSALAMAALTAAFAARSETPDDAKPSDHNPHSEELVQPPLGPTSSTIGRNLINSRQTGEPGGLFSYASQALFPSVDQPIATPIPALSDPTELPARSPP